jgi:beta-glucosidase
MQDIFEQTHFEAAVAGNAGNKNENPVKVETFSNETFSAPAATVSYVDGIATWRPLVWTPGLSTHKTIRYSARFTPKRTGSHLFLVAGTASDAYRLYVDGHKVLEQISRESQAPQSVELNLKAGSAVTVQLDYVPGANEQRISLGIRAIDDLIDARSLAIAAQSDTAIVSVGFDANTESEGFDRPYTLPYGQDALISAIAKANKNTVVVLTAGGEVDTHRWLDHVPAFLHLWYPGEEGGRALAEILTGERAPEGKLPISFASSWEDSPVHDHYYPADGDKRTNPHVQYQEGVFLGYRYYLTRNKPVLYPFGFGLSYTTFSLSGLSVSPASIGSSNEPVTVSLDVTNTGARTGAEVVQLYLGDPSAKLERPVKELKGFAKVHLESGQTQHVTFTVKGRDFCYWDEQGHRWKADPGLFRVYVGNSSQNTPLSGEFRLGAE